MKAPLNDTPANAPRVQRVGIDIGPGRDGGRALDAGAFRPDRDRGVGAQLDLAREHGVEARLGHHHEHDLRILHADLRAERRRPDAVEGGRAPCSVGAAGEQHAVAAGAADDEPGLEQAGHNQDRLGPAHPAFQRGQLRAAQHLLDRPLRLGDDLLLFARRPRRRHGSGQRQHQRTCQRCQDSRTHDPSPSMGINPRWRGRAGRRKGHSGGPANHSPICRSAPRRLAPRKTARNTAIEAST